MTRAKTIVLAVLDIAIAVGALGAWLSMFMGLEGGQLQAVGLWSLRYFTVLSNILMAVVSLVCFTQEVRMISGRIDGLPHWANLLRFVGVNAVSLTLIVVLGFLGPTMGYAAMFAGPNLYLHLLVPVAAIASILAFGLARGIGFRESLLGMVPLCLYAIFYVGNILINGLGEPGASNDWYGFLGGNVSLIPVVLLIIGIVAFIIASALRKLCQLGERTV